MRAPPGEPEQRLRLAAQISLGQDRGVGARDGLLHLRVAVKLALDRRFLQQLGVDQEVHVGLVDRQRRVVRIAAPPERFRLVPA